MRRDSRYLESILHHDIPLTREMGLKVLDWQDRQLQLRLPLDANINHKSTMFGGSLYCGAVLAGWGWLHLQLREEGIEDGHIVIQEGQISYPLPVTTDATAICQAPDDKVWKRFLATYKRYGRARLALETWIVNEGSEERAVTFTGQYVLHTFLIDAVLKIGPGSAAARAIRPWPAMRGRTGSTTTPSPDN